LELGGGEEDAGERERERDVREKIL